jgi:hypothetical protein
MRAFGEEDVTCAVLTMEHVPPKALGGIGLVLTCASCNSSAGHRVDHHMVSWHRLLTFGTPEAKGFLPARASIGAVTQQGEALFNGNSFTFIGVEKQNRPETAAAAIAEMESLAALNEVRGTFSFGLKLNERLARIGWMRAAYLLAFCQFGYSCIRTPPYQRLRTQIQDPAAELIDPRLVTVDREADPDQRALVVPSSPSLLADALICRVRLVFGRSPAPGCPRRLLHASRGWARGDADVLMARGGRAVAATHRRHAGSGDPGLILGAQIGRSGRAPLRATVGRTRVIVQHSRNLG